MDEKRAKDWRKVGIALGAGWIVVSSIAISALVGLGLDRLFHTRRLFLVIMFLVGIGAGMYNLVREMKKMDND
jgi:F0F1-type ATP synthase assembly protein I